MIKKKIHIISIVKLLLRISSMILLFENDFTQTIQIKIEIWILNG